MIRARTMARLFLSGNRRPVFLPVFGWASLAAAIFTAGPAAGAEGPIRFEKTRLDDTFRAEGVAAADFNGDGKTDIAAGNVYYAAPDWTMVPLEKAPREFKVKGYSDAFCCFADDFNRDGHTDLLVVGLPSRASRWYENPGRPAEPWPQHVAVEVTSNETPLFADLLGDGRKVLICGWAPTTDEADGPARRLICARPGENPTEPWPPRFLSQPAGAGSKRYAHGLGVGDMDGDGRADVVTTAGWYHAPADRARTPWPFRPASLGEHCADMIVADVDADGDADVVSSSAHRYGLWWHEQTSDGFTTHTIDDEISQTHALIHVDLDGDGLKDLVTGKRYYAHNGRDPGAEQPAVLVWYRFARTDGQPTWTRYTIDDDSGVGTQFQVADVDGDGRPDVVTANKKGVHYFRQVQP